MLHVRVIPSLLVRDGGLVKTMKFGKARYIGDPINAIRIFNDKEVDELTVLDIEATRRGSIDFALLSRINKEAFMPLGYGGGIKTVDDIKRILQLGYEKVVINSAALKDPDFVTRAASACGSQSVVCCIDVKADLLGQRVVYDHVRRKPMALSAAEWAKRLESRGAGELIAYSVDRDGMFSGYDIGAVKCISSAVGIPVVALGGARNTEDFRQVIDEGGASAVAAGSMFVFHGLHRAVLITYPSKTILKKALT